MARAYVTSRWHLVWLVIAALLIVAAGAYVTSGAPTEASRGVNPSAAVLAAPVFPFASTDGSRAQLLGRSAGREYYVAPGKGPTAGMTCFITVSGDVAHTGCDSQAIVDERGVMLSADRPGNRLAVFGYVPVGLERAQAGSATAPVRDRVVSIVVPRSLDRLTLTGSGRSLVLDIPGARP